MATNTDVIKTCPSCGGECQCDCTSSVEPDRRMYDVNCGRCGMMGADVEGKEAAIAAWNRLPRRSEIHAELIKLANCVPAIAVNNQLISMAYEMAGRYAPIKVETPEGET